MPISITDAPDTLPEQAKKIYVGAFNSAYDGICKEQENRDECSAKIAWSAVKRKYKKQGDEWLVREPIKSFSMHIQRASYDKVSNQMNWRAVASDTVDDLAQDNMTAELFYDFLRRAKEEESPPDEHCSSFWCGGIPYLSVSHYDDMDGEGVPGTINSLFVDGNRLKAKGTFNDTSLGRSCFQSVCNDLYADDKEKTFPENPVRISIAFLDWKHRHKKSGKIFQRTDDNICPECIVELFGLTESQGKEYLSGMLIHLALTRIPMNERTLMEVEKSMATKKEDALSIVGEELAEKLDELSHEGKVGKSGALVVKTDEEIAESEEIAVETAVEDTVEVSESSGVDELLPEIKPAEVDVAVEEPAIETDAVEDAIHPELHWSTAVDSIREAYDEAVQQEKSFDDALRYVQPAYEALGNLIKDSILERFSSDSDKSEKSEVSKAQELVVSLPPEFAEAFVEMSQKLDLLIQAQRDAVVPRQDIPRPLNIRPTYAQSSKKAESSTPKLREIIEKTIFNR